MHHRLANALVLSIQLDVHALPAKSMSDGHWWI
jgi:hypothetical protein